MMKLAVALVGALALVGCGSSQKDGSVAAAEPAAQPASEPAASAEMMGQQGMAGMCPMRVEGTTARSEQVEGGAAVAFTTTGEVAELRRRVARMAEMHNQHGGPGHRGQMGMHGGQAAGGGPHAHGQPGAGEPGAMMKGGMMTMPAATARSEEIEGGARIVLTPEDPADLDALREHVEHMASMMTSGECPMMTMHAQSAEPAASAPSDHEAHH